MGIEINTVDLRKGQEAGFVQSFGSSFNEGISIVMASANHNGYFFVGSYYFSQLFYFFINSDHGMAVRIYFFFIAVGILFDQVFEVTKIKMPQHQDIIAQEKIIALDI